MAKGRRKGSHRNREKERQDEKWGKQRMARETQWYRTRGPEIPQFQTAPIVPVRPRKFDYSSVKGKIVRSLIEKIRDARTPETIRKLAKAVETAVERGAISEIEARALMKPIEPIIKSYEDDVYRMVWELKSAAQFKDFKDAIFADFNKGFIRRDAAIRTYIRLLEREMEIIGGVKKHPSVKGFREIIARIKSDLAENIIDQKLGKAVLQRVEEQKGEYEKRLTRQHKEAQKKNRRTQKANYVA